MSTTDYSPRIYNSAVATAKSALTEARLKTLEDNLKTLQYLEGSGMTARKKLHIRNDMAYLVIGLGGQGIEKMKAVRRQLERDCTSDDIQKYVRFLAVDTDQSNLNNQFFLPTEIVEIRPGVADRLADPNSPQYLAWIHPELNIHITGLQSSFGWSSDGANQNRQVGRVKLADDQNRRNLVEKARTALLSVLNNRSIKTARVIIIAGLAGGTGSGMVVDIPYIIREKVSKEIGTGLAIEKGDFIVEGYLLLPPACGKATGAAAISGNRNAYAALKEIDYYMTLKEMHDANPHSEYRFCDIRSTENIFDTCTLVDGMFAGGGAVQDPSKLASETVAHTIVTSIANVTAKDERGHSINRDMQSFFGSASYISNMRAIAEAQLLQADYVQCPREANYRFLSCGYSEVIIPVDLMALYVANKVFNRIWQDYNRAFTINANAVSSFLERSGLTVRAIRDELNRGGDVPTSRLPKRALDYMASLFKQNGPYYMINLLHDTVQQLTHEYIEKQHRYNWGYWDSAKQALRRYRGYLQELQNQDYSVYTVVIEQLQKILENDANILTDSRRHQTVFGETFYWTPFDLSMTSDKGQMAVRDYLNHLLSDEDIEQMADNFRDELVDNRDYWVDIFTKEGKYDAASRIRDFIKRSIGNKINDSVEDFLVKLYSKEEDASVANNDQDGTLSIATSNIYDYFDAHSAPLAYMDAQDTRLFANGLRNFILPDGAGDIAKKLIEEHGVDSKNIYFGSANDRLICISMYGAVPAFFYRWIKDGEAAYEKNTNAIGLHIDQERGLEHGGWADLPNLIPRGKKLRDISPREQALYNSAEALLNQAILYQIATPILGNDAYHYQLRLLKDNPAIGREELLESAKEKVSTYINNASYPFYIGKETANRIPEIDSSHNLLDDMVFDLGILTEVNLKYGTWDLKPGNPNVCAKMSCDEKAEYTKDLAIKLLCKSLDMKSCLEQTVELVAYSENCVSQRNAAFALRQRKAARLDSFRKLLVSNVVYRKEKCWEYNIDGTPKILVNYVNEHAVVQKFNLYLAFLKFTSLPDNVFEEITDYYEEQFARNWQQPYELEANRERWYQEIDSLTRESDRRSDYSMLNETFAQKVQAAEWRDMSGNIISSNEITEFYTKMKSALQPTLSDSNETKLRPKQLICTVCGKIGIDSSAKFCPECGAKLRVQVGTLSAWDCTNCGKTGIDSEVKYCPECGARRDLTWSCVGCGKSGIASDVKYCPECGTARP